MDIIRFKPIPRPAIWGKVKLRNYFDYHDFPEGIGQSWSFSGQPGKSSLVIDGPFKGLGLDELWKHQPHLFHSQKNQFPFIIGLVGPEDSLSVQVHPDQLYADAHHLPSGKNEAWYFIEADEGADLIYGTSMTNKEALVKAIAENRWTDIVKRQAIHTGDFIYIPAGKLHALQKNVIVYEVQEATDVTYRFYDYDRRDAQGNPRPLHLQEALDCVRFTSDEVTPKPEKIMIGKNIQTVFIKNEYFTITKYEISEPLTLPLSAYELFTVIAGEVVVDGQAMKKGESFLAPWGIEAIKISGLGTLMSTKE